MHFNFALLTTVFYLFGKFNLNAQDLSVLNFSFEVPYGAMGTVAGVPEGWVASNLNPWGVFNPDAGLYTNAANDVLPAPAQGSQVLWIDAVNYVAQFLTNTLAPSQTYTLSGAIGNRSDGYGIQQPADHEYVYLLAGNTILAKNTNLPHPAPGSFLPWSITYTTPPTGFPTGPLEIRLGQTGAGQVHFDNLSLIASPAVVPKVNPAKADVSNFSFEVPYGAMGTVAGVPEGWVASNLNPWGVFNPDAGLYTNAANDVLPAPAQGSQVLWIDAVNYVAQFLTNTLAPSQTYTLSGAIGNRSDGYGIQQPADHEYVYLLAGNTILAKNTNLPHPAPGSFLPWSITYTTPPTGFPTGPLEIRLGQTGAGQVHFDNLSLAVGRENNLKVTSSNISSPSGIEVTFVATITCAGEAPTGDIMFFDGTNKLGSVPLDDFYNAALITSSLSVETSPHCITAVYEGDKNFGYNTSPALWQTITNISKTEQKLWSDNDIFHLSVFNFSFEVPYGAMGTVAGVPEGWVASNLNPWGVFNPDAGLYTNAANDVLPAPAQGSQVLWIDAVNYVAQFLTNTLAPGQTYTLSGAIGNRSDGYGIQQPADHEYVYLLAGNTILAKNTNLPHPAPGSFLPWSITYTTPTTGFPTGPLEIRLGQTGAGQVHFDNLALVASPAVVPKVNPARADVFNFSFEVPYGAMGTVAGVPEGWVASNLNPWGVFNPDAGLYTNAANDVLPAPAQGSQVLWIDAVNYVAQFLTNTLAPGQTYTLSGAIGNRSDGYGIQQPADHEYVYLLAGNTILAKNTNLPHPAPGSFLPWSITYTTPTTGFPTGPLEIRLGQTGAGQVHFDNLALAVGRENEQQLVSDYGNPTITKLFLNTNGSIQLNFAGKPQTDYIIQGTTNITFPWESLETNSTDATGMGGYVDQNSNKFPNRFYRIMELNF